MYLERLLQINMATLAALGAMLLGMGQRSEGPPLLVALAAVLSVWLTDVSRRFRLGRRTANLLMLLAAAAALRDLFPLGSEFQALALAWLLIYLQIIFLFQSKDERMYWVLAGLSLLQVVVATLFSQGIFFGVLLAVYMLLGFSAMTLLLMYRQWAHHRPAALSAGTQRASSVPRWPLSLVRPEFTGLPSGSGHAGIGNDLLRRWGRMGLQTLGLTLVLFFAVPRLGLQAWRGAIAHPQPLVGFTDKVTLGELGRITESHEPVMRVQFYRESDRAPQPINGPIYLQGAVMMLYDQGQWRMGHPTDDIGIQTFQRPDKLPPPAELVRQKTTIENLELDELFFVAPYVPLEENLGVEIDCARERLCRAAAYQRARRLAYTLGTTAIVNGEQSPLVPAGPKGLTNDASAMPRGGDGSNALPNLVALAKRWIEESGLPESDRLGRARCLEQKLAASGQFQYSLTGQDRDPNLDPIEDFVAKHPVGHCEYFATALTLMLRSQKIPARMVSGYKCDRDDWDSLGGYYQVRQFHAHTWVEAYLWSGQLRECLRSGQLRRDWLHGKDYWPWFREGDDRNGAWVRLDPTPAGASDERTNWFTPIREKLDWLESAWSNYVVELDVQTQRDAIYGPIVNGLRIAWEEATSPSRWRAMFNSVAVALYLDHLNREARWAVLGLAAIVAAAMLLGAVWWLWRLGRRLTARWTGYRPRRAGGGGVEVEFYRRFERLLARRGLVRAAAQTQREFAAAAGTRLATLTGEARLAALPAVVADAFYRVRFGRTPLDNSQTQAVEQALQELLAMGRSVKGAIP